MKHQNNRIFFFLYLFFWLGENCLSQYLGIFYEQQGLTGMQIGIVSGVFNGAVIAAALLVGMAGDALGNTRRLLVLLCGGMILGTGLLFFVRSWPLMLLAVAAYGFAYSPFNGIADKALMSRLQASPHLFGRYRMGGTLGAGIGVLIAGALVSRTPFLSLFAVYWAAALLCGGCALALPAGSAAIPDERVHLRDYAQIIRIPAFLPIYLTLAVWGFTESGVMQFQALHVARCGLEESYTSLFVAAAMAGECITFALAPRIIARLGTAKTIALAFFLQFCRMGSLTLLGILPLPLVIFCQTIGGGAYASLYSVITQAISERFPEKVSCSAHTLKLVVNRGIGTTCGSLLLGVLYEHGALTQAYGVLTLVAGLYIGASLLYTAIKHIFSLP